MLEKRIFRLGSLQLKHAMIRRLWMTYARALDLVITPFLGIIFSNLPESKAEAHGDPHFKPCWSPDLLHRLLMLVFRASKRCTSLGSGSEAPNSPLLAVTSSWDVALHHITSLCWVQDIKKYPYLSWFHELYHKCTRLAWPRKHSQRD